MTYKEKFDLVMNFLYTKEIKNQAVREQDFNRAAALREFEKALIPQIDKLYKEYLKTEGLNYKEEVDPYIEIERLKQTIKELQNPK